MRTKIISAFPGMGKSFYTAKHPLECLDSDSSYFSWVYKDDGTKERNPEFPENYIRHIKFNIGKFPYIFVSSHDVVRQALLDNCLFFYLVYPNIYRKKEFLKRYEQRGNDSKFISLVDKNWNNWISECDRCCVGCDTVILDDGDNIEQMINTWEAVP